jgi:tape measure domain-containing protein
MTVAELTAKISVVGEAAAVRALSRVGQSAKSVGEAIRTAADATRLFEIAQNSFASVTGVQAAMAYDSQVRGLAAYAKNAEELQTQLGRLKEIAKLPGLGLTEVRAGVLNLEAAGLSAQTSERALMAFGNALALVGKGKSELDGVILALGQIASKGAISAEEINQIAERVPQIRQVLVSAFGTASTEAIQKMGLSADVAIGKIIAGLEQLPKATTSALTTFENLQDALEQAFLPIGRGILDIFSSAEGGTMRLIDLITNIGKQIGEVFTAIGKSGVIQDVFSKFLSGTGVANFQQMMVGAIANILAYMGQIPNFWNAAVHDMGVAFEFVKESMIYYFGEAFNWAAGKYNELIDAFSSGVKDFGTAFLEFIQPILTGLKQAIAILTLGTVQLPGGELPNVGLLAPPNTGKIPIETQTLAPPKFAPTAGNFMLPSVIANANEIAAQYQRAIMGNLGPQGLPGGMIYGGAQGTGGGLGGPSIADNIGRIADNTKTAADALTLRRETLGGGQLGQMGVTAAEMAVGGGGGIRMGDFMGGGNRGLIPAGTELERAVRSVIRDEARRNGTPGIMKRF